MYLDQLIDYNFLDKIRSSKGIELNRVLNSLNDYILKALGENSEKSVAEFYDESFKQYFLDVLLEKGKQETDTHIRIMIINYILFTAPFEAALGLAKDWLQSILANLRDETQLLHSVLITLDRNGIKLNWDLTKKESTRCGGLLLVANEYLKMK